MLNGVTYTISLLGIFLSSCCLTVEEEHLGNNLYLSEYDNVDRRVLYSEEKCSGTGVEIVPMTVLEFSYNDKWIIAKSGSERQKSNFGYWIIQNSYQSKPDAETIKANTFGPLDLEAFKVMLSNNNIELELQRID